MNDDVVIDRLKALVTDVLTSAVVDVVRPCLDAQTDVEPTPNDGPQTASTWWSRGALVSDETWACAEIGFTALAAERGWDLTALRRYARALIGRLVDEIDGADAETLAAADEGLKAMHATFADAGMYSGIPLKDRVRTALAESVEALKAEVELEPEAVRGEIKSMLAMLFQAQLDAKALIDQAIVVASYENPDWHEVRNAILAVDRHVEAGSKAQKLLVDRYAHHPAVQYGMAQLTERVRKLRSMVPASVLVDYAPGVTDLVERIRVGCKTIRTMSGGGLERFYAEVDELKKQARRHEISRQETSEVVDLLKQALESLDSRVQEQHIEQRRLIAEIARLQTIAAGYHRGPTAMVALEQQLLALRINHTLFHMDPREDGGALQGQTLKALKVAEPYCWSSEPVEAVTAAAALLADDVRPNVSALGELAAPAACGWWWFETPIPVQTTRDVDDPVVALLWKREVHPEKGAHTWFSTFVAESAQRHGRMVLFATPSSSWLWRDSETIAAMTQGSQTEYRLLEKAGKLGWDVAPEGVVEQSEIWFTRFWLAAGLWLQQRVVSREPARLPRQQARALAREYKRELPTVQIVNLRRRAQAAVKAETAGRDVHWSCRWIVSGFWRNQFYPSRNEHAPKWIESYVKGPDGAPLKTATRVYRVHR